MNLFQLHPKLHPKTHRRLSLLFLSLAGGVIVHGIALTRLNGSALVYLGLPWLVAVLLTLTERVDTNPESSEEKSTVRGALIVMLGSSVLLGEGFLCVLLFLPIYMFVVAVVAFASYVSKRRAHARSKLQPVHALPLLIALMALEGTHPDLSFERQGSVTVQKLTSIDQQQLWANLREPMVLNRSASSGLSRLFPQPVKVEIDSFEPGALHKVHYRYARWLWTNVHEGSLELRLTEVGDHAISARVTHNSSYLANYLDIEQIRLRIADHTDDQSLVAIDIDYKRTLDPAWYFSPLIRLALRGTASHIIQTHIFKAQIFKERR